MKKLQHQSVKNYAFLKVIFDSLPNAVFITDQNGRIITINKKTDGLFGYEEDELTDRQISIYFDDPAQYMEVLEKGRLPTCLVTKNGAKIKGNMTHVKVGLKTENSFFRILNFDELADSNSIKMSLSERFEFERLLTELFATFINYDRK